MSNQKTHYKTGVLSQERIALLSLFVPGWHERKRKRPDWEEAFAELKAFVEKHQRFPSEVASSEEEQFICAWLGRQKEDRTAKRDKRHSERVARMDRELPGWRMSKPDALWQKNFDLLKVHVERTGRSPIFSNRLPEELGLAQWLSSQRTRVWNGEMLQERKSLLDDVVPGWHEKGNRQETMLLVDRIIADRLASQEPSVTISMTSASAPYSPAR
jgi:hypothetical protein